jgi:hypothetical protein
MRARRIESSWEWHHAAVLTVHRPLAISLCVATALMMSTVSCSDDDTAPAAPATPATTTTTTTHGTLPVTPTTATTGATTADTPATAGTSVLTVAPSTTARVVDVGLVLAADGLELFDFGASRDEVVATLTDLLGAPDEAPEPPAFPINDVCRQSGDYCPIATARWRHLTLQFRAVDEGVFLFSGYEFGRDVVSAGDGRLQVRPWRPTPWERGVATVDGLTVGSPSAKALAIHPEVWAIDCAAAGLQRIPLADTDEYLRFGFVRNQPSGLYLYPPLDGELRRIGAMDRPDATFCEGA